MTLTAVSDAVFGALVVAEVSHHIAGQAPELLGLLGRQRVIFGAVDVVGAGEETGDPVVPRQAQEVKKVCTRMGAGDEIFKAHEMAALRWNGFQVAGDDAVDLRPVISNALELIEGAEGA